MTIIEKYPISGQVAAGFEPVRAAFENNYIKHGEVGAAVHVTINGEPVVDLWAGAADMAGKRPWTADTLVNVWSTTKGWLNGEVLRRITGMSVGQFIRTEIAEPLGAAVFVGLSDQEQACTAETVPPSLLGQLIFKGVFALRGRTQSMPFTNPPRPVKAVNTKRWREAEIPSSNGHASARGLAKVYTPLALGGKVGQVQLLSAASVERASREQVYAKDVVIGTTERRTLGFMLPPSGQNDPRPLTAFGHPGMGGSIGFADPQHHLALGYVMNKMIIGPDKRFADLCRAVYACLDIGMTL